VPKQIELGHGRRRRCQPITVRRADWPERVSRSCITG
jgi:hypothetical protein